MSPIEMRRDLKLGASAALLFFLGGCRGNSLTLVAGALVFSSPDQPDVLEQPDAGVVRIAFGQVRVGSTRTLALAFNSIGSPVTLGTLDASQPDSEFSLPFPSGTVGESSPTQIAASFTPTSTGEKSAVYQLNDFAPKPGIVIFELSGEGIGNAIGVTPNPVEFGPVELNQSQSVELTITNDGPLPAPLTLSSLEGPDAEHFTLGSPSPTTLAPGGSATLSVAFFPKTDGSASATFTVGGGSTDQPTTVSLGGIGVDSWIEVTSPLSFGFVQLGDSFVKSAIVTNISQYTTRHLITPAPELVKPSGPFSLAWSTTVPLAIPPGQFAQIPIAFQPGSFGSFSGTLDLTTDDPGKKFPVVELQGYGGGPKISCLPLLSFGPVDVGSAASRDASCSNVGSDIPSFPNLALDIAQSDLRTGSAAFVANLVLSDGGLATFGDRVSLSPGQKTQIRVSFHPEDAGTYDARLVIPSNDLDDADAGTLLAGQGGLTGPCELQLNPIQLGFGEVQVGGRGMEFELLNTSQTFCHIAHVGLDPESDPAFSLPDGGIGAMVLSYPGDTDDPALSSSVILQAEFAPTKAEAAAGTIDIITLDGLPLDETIALTGLSQQACLSLEPSEVDFGVVGFSPTAQQICAADSATIVALNQCDSSLTLKEIAVSPSLAGPPQFSLATNMTLPLTLAPGSQASFQTNFVPTSIGKKLGAIRVATSDLPSTPYLVTLQGNAELSGRRTDTFVVPALPKKVDLLWVLDDDDDASQVQVVAATLPQLITTMDEDQLDYQIAVTSTDTCGSTRSDRGSFEPCDHCLTAGTAPSFTTPTTFSLAQSLINLFNGFDLGSQGFCEGLNGDEHFFDSIAAAFAPDLLSGHNSGFLRSDAYLAIVVVNSDTEDDAAGLGAGGPYLTNLNQVTTLVQGLKPDPKMVSVSYINPQVDPSQQIGQLVQRSGGLEIGTSTPTPDYWQDELFDLFIFMQHVGPFQLTSTPAAPTKLQVEVDGVPTTAWAYQPYARQLVLGAGELPPQGAVVSVTYDVGCP